jgi:hypothetical protein
VDEINNQLDFIEGGTINKLRDLLKNYYDKPEDDSCMEQLNQEVTKILDLVDQ